MRRFIPDGNKIVELRDKKCIKQLALAQEARLSDRTLRKIERNNCPVQEHVLINIATALGVAPNEITYKLNVVPFSKDESKNDLSPTQMKLRIVSRGGDLFSFAQKATLLKYSLLVDPSKDTVDLMSNLLSIVQAAVDPYNEFSESGSRDGYEGLDFPDLHRIARLGDVISQLRHMGVSVLANYYERMALYERRTRGTTRVYLQREVRLHVCMCSSSQDEYTIEIEPDDKYPEGYNYGDEIPF